MKEKRVRQVIDMMNRSDKALERIKKRMEERDYEQRFNRLRD